MTRMLVNVILKALISGNAFYNPHSKCTCFRLKIIFLQNEDKTHFKLLLFSKLQNFVHITQYHN